MSPDAMREAALNEVLSEIVVGFIRNVRAGMRGGAAGGVVAREVITVGHLTCPHTALFIVWWSICRAAGKAVAMSAHGLCTNPSHSHPDEPMLRLALADSTGRRCEPEDADPTTVLVGRFLVASANGDHQTAEALWDTLEHDPARTHQLLSHLAPTVATLINQVVTP